ncbi:nuclear transport factor 2 family protein [Pedobacter polaris]|uniref:Nuclear transport factor 2 family protein n=1 Tax=Pedobacter polaris TaxID=2571273 RepID=A0A4U1CTE4_9SPHI|nr:nuclear transport factor 2 family protein [Pedobacter polaris]TKC12451.1 nuclear transport factor 2 family protein [Pedobacter polaris]
MKQISLLLLLIVLSFNQSFAQAKSEEEAVKATINLLFDGMRNADTTMLRKAFAGKNTMETIAKTKDGKFVVRTENLNNFIKSVGTPHTEKYDERIVFTKILIDANLASVWTDYKFYVGDKFSHCGVNSFQLFKGEDGWKIIYLIDTRRKDNCN